MNAQSFMTLIVAAGWVFAVVWVLNKIGKALTTILEALAALAAHRSRHLAAFFATIYYSAAAG